jgi:hypothetical protein
MSCTQSEHGTFRIPTAEWAALKLSLIAALNWLETEQYRLAQAIFARLSAAAKGQRNFNYHAAYEKATAIRARPSGHSRSLDPERGDLRKAFSVRTKHFEPSKDSESPPLIGTRSVNVVFNLSEASIALDTGKHEARWHVSESKSSVDRVHEHKMANAFFGARNAIKWTRGSGGYVIYTDEYQQESDNFGGGSTVNNALGPIGEADWRHVAAPWVPTSV